MTAKVNFCGLLLALFIAPCAASAHRLDEYLQATLVTIAPEEVRLQINLTPGVAIADQIIALIDRDHDGMISTNEAKAYAESLTTNFVVKTDLRTVELKLAAFNFPDPADLRAGWGLIQLEYRGQLPTLASGSHVLGFDNRYLPKQSVYLLNAARPDSTNIQIIAQKRNDTQSLGEIDFTVQSPATSPRAIRIVSLSLLAVVMLAGLRQAIKSGA